MPTTLDKHNQIDRVSAGINNLYEPQNVNALQLLRSFSDPSSTAPIPSYGFQPRPNPTGAMVQQFFDALQDPRLGMAFPGIGAMSKLPRMGTGAGAMLGDLFHTRGLSGGSHLLGPGAQAARDLYSTIDDIAAMEPGQQSRIAENIVKSLGQGFRDASPQFFNPGQRMPIFMRSNPTMAAELVGGMRPSKGVWERAINAAGGMNNLDVQRMLGFGQ